jgi:hypothetical protein
MSKGLLRSFAGGEISPELFGRVDLSKFQTGLGLCRNFISLPHGPVARRPGFQFAGRAKDSTNPVRILPFVFSVDQSAVLEFGAGYIRVYSNGAPVLEPEIPLAGISNGDPAEIRTAAAHGYATGDSVYLTRVSEMPALNNRIFRVAVPTANAFELQTLAGEFVSTAGMPVWGGLGAVARLLTIAAPYTGPDLFDLHITQDSDVLTITHPKYPTRELRRLGAATWVLATVSFAPTLVAPTGLDAVATSPAGGNFTTHTYAVTSVDTDGVTESLASVLESVANDLSLSGNVNTLSWSAATGASRYNIYKQRSGTLGFIGQTTGLSIVDNNVLPDIVKVPPEAVIELNSEAGNYPAAVTYHEQRRWFAGSDLEPQTVWATRNGTGANLTSSFPSQDDDAIKFRVASRQQNRIRHLIPLSDLIALTAGGEFRVFSDNAPAITPTSLSVKPLGYAGSSNVQPVTTSSSIVFVQAQGSRVRELSQNADGYRTVDLSIMAPHLVNGKQIVDLAYTRAPDQIAWAVRSDGVLLGLTYVPDQQVYGWHQHDTAGAFESVCVVPEAGEDVLYAVVRRTIGGGQVRHIERLSTRVFSDAEDSFYLDAGLTYRGGPASTISGLHHLEGEVVTILADGATVEQRRVVAGAVSLSTPASVVHIGLPYISDFATLPLSSEGAAAAGQGTTKNISKVHLRVAQSSLVQVGPTFGKLRQAPAREVLDPYDSPPPLRSGEVSLTIDPKWNTEGAVCVRQAEPLPLTVVSMVLEFATGG